MEPKQVRSYEEIPLVILPDDYQRQTGTFLANAAKRYGPIFRATFIGREIVFLLGAEANRLVLSGQRQKFSHYGGWGKMINVVEAFGNGLLTMDNPEHDIHRRMMNPAFNFAHMDRYLPVMNRIARNHVDRWGASGEVDLYEEARKYSFDVAAETLAGLQAGQEVDRFQKLYTDMTMMVRKRAQGTDNAAEVAECKKEVDDMVRRQIAIRRASPEDDALGMLVQARDDQGQPLTDDQLIAHVHILLVAGHETSTSLIAWLLYLLEEHPEYLARVLEEQGRLFSGLEDTTLETINQMSNLNNGVNEALRLRPPVGQGPRTLLEDVEFNGYLIPAGTHIFYGIVGTHLDSEIFADPFKFDPDRFAAPRDENKKTPYGFAGFGGGPRICIGIHFAHVEVKTLVSHVLRQYKLALVPDQQIVQFYRATGLPLNGIKMRVMPQAPYLRLPY